MDSFGLRNRSPSTSIVEPRGVITGKYQTNPSEKCARLALSAFRVARRLYVQTYRRAVGKPKGLRAISDRPKILRRGGFVKNSLTVVRKTVYGLYGRTRDVRKLGGAHMQPISFKLIPQIFVGTRLDVRRKCTNAYPKLTAKFTPTAEISKSS